MKWTALSHIGLVRKANDDSYLVSRDRQEFLLAMIADGMGGYEGGKVASELSLKKIIEYLHQYIPEEVDEATAINYERIIKDAVRYANDKVYKTAQEHKPLNEMGTTLDLVLAFANKIIIAHVGDSRIYLISEDGISQLTDDHTFANAMIAGGEMSEEEILTHRHRNKITRALGAEKEIEVDVKSFDWKSGDKVLLCTDGLTKYVSEDKIYLQFAQGTDLKESINELLEMSLSAGGKDNITMVVLGNSQEDNLSKEDVDNFAFTIDKAVDEKGGLALEDQ